MTNLTYKYRLKGKRAKRRLRRHAWASNQAWNFCVQTQKKTQRNWKDGGAGRWPTQFDLQRLSSGSSKDLGLHAQSIQGVCEQFVKSRDQHRKCPKFRKSSGPKKSLGWIPFTQQSRKIEGNSIIYLGHAFRFFGAKRRPLPEIVKGGSFVEDSRGNWYICFHVQAPDIKSESCGSVGIDLGLKTLATTSDGEKHESLHAYRKLEAKLGIAQKANNKKRVSAINAQIKNQRQDYLHKLSYSLVNRYKYIYVGDVSSSGLAKTNMAKSVNDSGWSTLRTMIRYKASRHGSFYSEVDEKFTSQICSCCLQIVDNSPKGRADLGIREWGCSGCGTSHDRDVNAAKNILRLGRSAAPLVEESRVA